MKNYEKTLEAANESLSNRLEKALEEKETLLKVLFLSQALLMGKTEICMKYKKMLTTNDGYKKLVQCVDKDDPNAEFVLFEKDLTDLVEVFIGSDEIQNLLESNEEEAKRMRAEVFQSVSHGITDFD